MAKDDSTTASLSIPATERYPWHESPWASLTQRLDILPHALLLYGQPGLGMRVFALRLARTLLCAQPVAEAEACGRCQSCLLLTAGSHPDIAVVEPLEDKTSIAIDQIRELAGFLSLRPHTATRKVVVIAPAEAMTLSAANSLLKMLEEPPLGSVIVLVTSHPARLPATIRSRCTRVLFKPPSESTATGWLQARPEMKEQPESLLRRAAGAPLLAIELAQEGFLANRKQLFQDVSALRNGQEQPSTCATRWKNLGTARSLAWLYSYVSDLIKMNLGVSDVSQLANPELIPGYNNNKLSIQNNDLYNLLDVINESYKQLSGPLDHLLLLEDILIRWSRLSRLH
jgi:DNA polymerase-3 subunit delta'